LPAADPRVEKLRWELEQALDRQLQGPSGCWPLLVGLAGLLLGLALLAGGL
jgi:hypothetical protein